MGSNRYKVSVIIPNYNRKKDLERLLPSIANQSFADYEVIIIDDFSPDKSAVQYIKDFVKNHKNMSLVENTENIGFVKTCNKGVKLADSEYVCILTNDTEAASNFIEKNVAIMDADRSIGVLSCIILDENQKIWFSGGSLKRWIPKRLMDDFQGVRPTDFAAGTACFYRKEVFGRIGFINEYYHMYHEDVEFCLRVRTETDFKVCMFGEKLVIHYTEAGSLPQGKTFYYLHRNLILTVRRYSPKSIPVVLLYFLREMMGLPALAVRRLRPVYLSLPLYIIRGTIAGFSKRGNERS